MIKFESYERREKQILSKLAEYGIGSIEEAEKITKDAGLDVYHMIENIQPICFENAKWAYTVGAAIAIKKGCRKAADAAAAVFERERLDRRRGEDRFASHGTVRLRKNAQRIAACDQHRKRGERKFRCSQKRDSHLIPVPSSPQAVR